jgi:putative hemolysin
MTEPGDKLLDSSEFVPAGIYRTLYNLVRPIVDRALGVNKLNRLYRSVKGQESPVAFCRQTLKLLQISYRLPEKDIANLKSISGPLVIVANHPFGAIEALFMLLLMEQIRPNYKIMANYILSQVSELKDILIAVDSLPQKVYNGQNYSGLKEAINFLQDGGVLGVFPAGEVSSYRFENNKVVDRAWSPVIAKLIMLTKASVLPIYFHGRNSVIFQMAAMLGSGLRNSMLIREFMYPTVQKLHYQIGSVISPDKIQTFNSPTLLAEYLRSKTYIMGHRYPRNKMYLGIVRRKKNVMSEAQEVIPPIPTNLLVEQISNLPAESLLLKYNDMDVYIFKQHQAPLVMKELGRLREVTYRAVGEGSGKSCDIDVFDQWYDQLIIWNRVKHEIVGAYRVGRSDEILATSGQKGLYTNTLFKIHKNLFAELTPALELGRSFVRKEYQRSYWALLLLWMGIGHFLVRYPHYKFLFGPVSISADFHLPAKNLMVTFLMRNNSESDFQALVKPKNPFQVDPSYTTEFYNSFSLRNLNDVQALISEIETSDLKIPILLKHYIKMGGKIIAFNVDPDFNNVLDGLMFIDLTKTDAAIMRKYLTPEGYSKYCEFQKISLSNTSNNQS